MEKSHERQRAGERESERKEERRFMTMPCDISNSTFFGYLNVQNAARQIVVANGLHRFPNSKCSNRWNVITLVLIYLPSRCHGNCSSKCVCVCARRSQWNIIIICLPCMVFPSRCPFSIRSPRTPASLSFERSFR